jgi:hypothetical protein
MNGMEMPTKMSTVPTISMRRYPMASVKPMAEVGEPRFLERMPNASPMKQPAAASQATSGGSGRSWRIYAVRRLIGRTVHAVLVWGLVSGNRRSTFY